MQRFIKPTHAFLSTVIIMTLSTPILAQCESDAPTIDSESTRVALTKADSRVLRFAFTEPGIVAIEAHAAIDAIGDIWLDTSISPCRQPTDGRARVLRRSGTTLVLSVDEPGTVPIRIAYSPEREGDGAEVTIVRFTPPARRLTDGWPARKDGSGDSGDGEGSEEADREIPPAAPPEGGDDDDGEGSEEADREIPPTILDTMPWLPSTGAVWCPGDEVAEMGSGTLCAIALEAGQTMSGVLTRAVDRRHPGQERHHFAINLDEPSRVSLGFAATRDLAVLLTDEANKAWMARSLRTANDEAIVHLMLPAGRYDLRLESKAGGTVRYGVTLESKAIR